MCFLCKTCLSSLITSKIRLRMLSKFFVSADNNSYLDGLAKEFNEFTYLIRKGLNNITYASFLLKSKQNNRVIYNANIKQTLFKESQKMVRQLQVYEEIVEKVISRIDDLDIIALTSVYIACIIQTVIYANQTKNEYLANIETKIRDIISKEVNFIIYNKVPEGLKI